MSKESTVKYMDQQPEQSTQPNVSNQFQPAQNTQASTTMKAARKSKFILLGIILAVFLVGGGAAAYVQFIADSPDKAWECAMSSTAKGLDKLVELSKVQSDKSKIEGTFSMSAPVAADGSVKAIWNGSNGLITGDLGVGGVRGNMEVRATAVENSEYPDMYIKVTGLEALGSLVDEDTRGLLAQANDQWYVLDHTFFGQYVAEASASTSTQLTEEDVEQAMQAVMGVVKDRLLTTDPQKAVLEVREELGKEDFEGTPTYKYKVGLHEQHFKEFLTALKESLKDSKLAAFMAEVSGMSYDELLNLEDIMKQIDEVDYSTATADVWVQEDGKYIRNVRFYAQENNNTIDIGVPYEGGDTVPITFKVTVDDDTSKGTVQFGWEINQNTAASRLWADMDLTENGTRAAMKGEMTVGPTDETITVEKPEGAKSVYELLGPIFQNALGSSLDDSDEILFDDDFDFDQIPLDDIEL